MSKPPLSDMVTALPYQDDASYPITALIDARNDERFKRARAANLRKVISGRRTLRLPAVTAYQVAYFAQEIVATQRYLANLRAARAVRLANGSAAS